MEITALPRLPPCDNLDVQNLMSNGLFIQSYPASGVQVVPATYTAVKGGYALLATVSIFIALMMGPFLLKSRWLPLAAITYAVAAFLALIFFRSFKLDVRTDGICYSNSLRSERFVAFAEMSTVVVFTNRWVNDEAAHGLNFRMPGTIIITPKAETGKPVLKIPLWLFSNPAESQVTHLLRPEEWDTDS